MLKPNPQIAEAAEMVESAICHLDYVLGASPDEVRDVAAHASSMLEIANIDIQGAIEDLLAAYRTAITATTADDIAA